MNSVCVEKFITNIGINANVNCVTFTNDVRNNRNTVALKCVTWFCHKTGDFSIILLNKV